MKNIQVIDGARNCVYDIFAVTDEEFALIFPAGQDVAFIEEVMARGPEAQINQAFGRIWERRIPKRDAMGIHGFQPIAGSRFDDVVPTKLPSPPEHQ